MCLFNNPFFQTANVVFFVLTSKQLYESWKFTRSQLKNETSSGNTAVSTIRICPRRQNANQNFKVILKLFVVMGITHFSELIGKAKHMPFKNKYKLFVLDIPDSSDFQFHGKIEKLFLSRNSMIYLNFFRENALYLHFLALFLIGFTLSWIYGRDRVWKYFVFNDVINLLQGVFIFFVLVCKPSVLSQIWPLSFPDRKKISISQVTQVTISNGNSK